MGPLEFGFEMLQWGLVALGLIGFGAAFDNDAALKKLRRKFKHHLKEGHPHGKL